MRQQPFSLILLGVMASLFVLSSISFATPLQKCQWTNAASALPAPLPYSAGNPVVKGAIDGQALILYSFAGELWGIRFDPDSQQWVAPEQLSDGVIYPGKYVADIDDLGNITVAWTPNAFSTLGVAIRRFEGGAWNPKTIFTTSFQYITPSVAALSNGRAGLVYTKDIIENNTFVGRALTYREYNAGTWSAETVISDSQEIASHSKPLTVSPNGKRMALSYKDSSNKLLFYNTQTGWGSPTEIPGFDVVTSTAYSGTGRNTHVVFQARQALESSVYITTHDGTSFGSVHEIGQKSNYSTLYPWTLHIGGPLNGDSAISVFSQQSCASCSTQNWFSGILDVNTDQARGPRPLHAPGEIYTSSQVSFMPDGSTLNTFSDYNGDFSSPPTLLYSEFLGNRMTRPEVIPGIPTTDGYTLDAVGMQSTLLALRTHISGSNEYDIQVMWCHR